MGTVHALMVGINDYPDPAMRLSGCRTDIADAVAFLEERRGPDTGLKIRRLLDAAATGTAIVEGFRGHLGQAGPGDTALFWFSGHGSTDPVPERFRHLESTGRLQTLVCADSRVDGRPELLDKELAVLLDEVAEGGCHVVVVLDCCHSGGATRGVRVRSVPPASRAPAFRLLPDLDERYAAGPPPIRHVLLAACTAEEKASEEMLGGAVRGWFSLALLRALRRSGPDTSYRQVLALARNEVERRSVAQTPQIFPPGPGPADQRVLGGGAISEPPAITMRHGRDGWEVNVGAAYGVQAGLTRFARDRPGPAPDVEVNKVGVGRSRVEPVGWDPDPGRVYPLVMVGPPRPTLFGIADGPGPPGLAGTVADPQVRIVDRADAELVIMPMAGGFRLVDRGGEEIAGLGADVTVAGLRHIARWWRVKSLRNENSRIAYGMILEVVRQLPGERIGPRERPAEPIGPDGTLRLGYGLVNGAPDPPRRFLRLRNTTDRALYCVLLNLTERFKISGDLLRPDRIEAGQTAAAYDGGPVFFELPEELENRPGSSYRDWLMLIVSTERIDPVPYEMAELDPARRDARRHDRRGAPPPRGDWWTSVLKVVTTGPEAQPSVVR